uniref:Transposase-associated domain-containing protein n=1 Tax=Solanum tuberosum TaxID=4113 RepID=M1CU82_SOLTU
MYNMHYETGAGLKPEFIDGVRNFIEHTMTLDIFKINGLVRCPCSACKCLEGIGSSLQAEALDGVQIAAMSDQITKLTAALAESERRRVAEQASMSETVQQIKEQVMNLARRPTTSAPDDTDDESDEDDYVDLTP